MTTSVLLTHQRKSTCGQRTSILRKILRGNGEAESIMGNERPLCVLLIAHAYVLWPHPGDISGGMKKGVRNE
jgi:hypothetical protein